MHLSLNRKLFFIMTTLLFSMGCSLADLTTETIRQADTRSELRDKAVVLFEKSLELRGGYSRYVSFDYVRLQGTDFWHSTLVRFFTPVTEQEQEFEAVISTTGNEIRFTFLNGAREGQSIGIEDGKTYKEINQEKKFVESSKIKLYLKPLADYFKWPYTLYDSPVLLYAGEKQVENESYHLLFVSSGGVVASPEHDQYMIFLNQRTHSVDYIDFTLRSLFNSYKGTLHYRDFGVVDGLKVPFLIGVSDGVNNQDFAHEFRFNEIRFTSLP
jgi:hypothetical protein